MNVREFKKSLKKGLGRCYYEIESRTDRERFKPIILKSCLRDDTYDTQSNGNKAQYLYELIELTCDKDYFLLPIMQKFSEHKPKYGWTFSLLCDMLELFALNGASEAKKAIEEKYEQLFYALKNKRSFRSYNNERDDFETAANALIDLCGIEILPKVAADMGTLFLERPKHYGAFDFEYFYFNANETFGEDAVKKVLTAAAEKSAEVAAFYTTMQTERERSKAEIARLRAEKDDEPTLPSAEEIYAALDSDERNVSIEVGFRYHGSTELKREMAALIEAETDEVILERALNRLFCEDLPVSVEKLIDCTKSGNCELSEAAFYALGEFKDDKVREFALSLLPSCNSDEQAAHALSMLIKNYRQGDEQLLLKYLATLDGMNEDDAHAIVMNMIYAVKNGVPLPTLALEYAYSATPCMGCRHSVVKLLSERAALSDALRKECLHDAYSETRKLAEKI